MMSTVLTITSTSCKARITKCHQQGRMRWKLARQKVTNKITNKIQGRIKSKKLLNTRDAPSRAGVK